MSIGKNYSKRSPKPAKSLEEVYYEFENKLIALKKEKDLAVNLILKKIDDEKIKKILSKIN